MYFQGRDTMKISTKGRYALRLMVDLATHNNGRPVSIRDIASRQNISDKYLEQIISSLNKAGYVKSSRGPQGGYTLMKEPEECTVGMILRLTEGNLSPVACLEEHMLWKKLDDAIKGVLDTVTLADLVDWQKESAKSDLI